MNYILSSVTLVLLMLLGGFVCIKILGITGDSLLYAGCAVGMIAQRINLSIFGVIQNEGQY